MCFFFVKQKTAYEMRISDWSSDVCSSDLVLDRRQPLARAFRKRDADRNLTVREREARAVLIDVAQRRDADRARHRRGRHTEIGSEIHARADDDLGPLKVAGDARSEEHTSEPQPLMRISYAVFCLKKK